MKKILALVLALTMILAFAACAKTETTTEDDTTTTTVEDVTPEFPTLTINTEAFTVTVADGYDDAGITAYICDTTAKYSFDSDNEAVSWKVYVLDNALEDEPRLALQSETTALEGNGVVDIEAGKYIYLVCSCSAFSGEDEPIDATLSINYAE